MNFSDIREAQHILEATHANLVEGMLSQLALTNALSAALGNAVSFVQGRYIDEIRIDPAHFQAISDFLSVYGLELVPSFAMIHCYTFRYTPSPESENGIHKGS